MVVGSIIISTSSVVPTGYHVCDGSEISREQYSELFDVIGTTYGPGNGSTTFNLPNLSGKVAVGQASGMVLGSTGGEATHVLQSSEIVAHTHDVPSHTHTSSISAKTPELSHTITQPMYKYNVLNGGLNANMLNKDFNAYTSTTSAAMTRSTNLSVAAHGAADCTMSGGITDCAALTTDAVGSDGSHNNMMPYLSLTYLIRFEPDVRVPRMLMFNGCMPCAPSGAYLQGRK